MFVPDGWAGDIFNYATYSALNWWCIVCSVSYTSVPEFRQFIRGIYARARCVHAPHSLICTSGNSRKSFPFEQFSLHAHSHPCRSICMRLTGLHHQTRADASGMPPGTRWHVVVVHMLCVCRTSVERSSAILNYVFFLSVLCVLLLLLSGAGCWLPVHTASSLPETERQRHAVLFAH